MENVIIIGSGPAAHTAAIYCGRSRLNPLLFEGMFATGVAAGGQLTTTTHVENYPGFPEPIPGQDLMARMRQQTLNCEGRIETQTVTKLDLSSRPFKVFTDSVSYETKTLIIATGAQAKLLDLPGHKKFWQKGISACAVCDGALPVFRNKVLAVIGGGDSAVEEATYLAKYASKVLVLHRRDELRASKIMQERVFANDKIEVIWDTVAVEALGENMLTGVKVKNVKTQNEKVLEVSGLFYAIGHQPNTSFLDGQLPLNEAGYILVEPDTSRTKIEGVFACGDVIDPHYRQAITAAGSGCKAAIDAEHYLQQIRT